MCHICTHFEQLKSHHVGQLALVKKEQNKNAECAITVHTLNS